MILSRSLVSLVLLVIFSKGVDAQSVFLQQYTHLPLKKIACLNDKVLVSNGYSFYVNDKNGGNVISANLSLSNAYLLQQMAVSPSGNVFCLYQYTTASYDVEMVVVCLDANMGVKWMKNINAGGATFGYGITATDDNGVVICGTSCSTGFFLLKMDEHSNIAFKKNITTPGFCMPYAISNYTNGGFIIVTRLQTDKEYAGIFIADNAGNITNVKSIPFNKYIYIKAVKSDFTGNIYTLINEKGGASDIISLSSNMEDYTVYQFTKENESIQLNDIAFSYPNIFAVGNINTGGSSNLDILTITLNAVKKTVISKLSSSPNTTAYDDAYSVVTGNDNRFYMSGTASADGYVAKVNETMTGFCNTTSVTLDGQMINGKTVNASYTVDEKIYFAMANGFASTTSGESVIAGFCNYQELPSSVTGIEEIANTDNMVDVNVYPNPAGSELNVSTSFENEGGVSCFISDILGRKVMVLNLGKNIGIQKIDISGLATGEYFISFIAENQTISKKFIKAQ